MARATAVGGTPALSFRTWIRDPGGLLTLALGVYTIVFLLWLVTGWGGDDLRTIISDVAFLPSGFAAAALAWRASTPPHRSERTRRAWQLLAGAFFVFFAGDVIWTYFEVVRGEAPFPSLADAGYLLFYPLVLGGLMAFPVAPQSKVEKTKFWLDALTVLLGGWMVVWYFVLGPTALAEDSPRLLTVLSAAYPIGDLVLIFGIAALSLQTTDEGNRLALRLLAAGVLSFLVADLSFGSLSLRDAYSGGDWPDGFWMVAQFLFASGAQTQFWLASHETAPDHPAVPEIHAVSPLPYAAVGLGYILLIVAGRSAPAYPLGGLIFGAIAVTAIVMARQLTLMNENIRLLGDLRALARTDSLTALHARRYFFELAHREFARARRYERPLAALMLDVDDFKPVNDRFGHIAGDEVLRLVAAQMVKEMREVDLLGRYGGDELVALLPESGEDAAVAAAERVRRRIAESTYETHGQQISITVSAGVASAEGCPDLQSLLRRADDALYRAKAAGRNCVRRFSEDR